MAITADDTGKGLARFDEARFGFRIVRLCRGRAEGRDFYAFLAIEPHNLEYFERHYQDGLLADFSAFGTELLRGWGEAPPAAIIDHVRDKYGVEFGVDEAYVAMLARMASSQARQTDEGLSVPLSFTPLSAAARKIL